MLNLRLKDIHRFHSLLSHQHELQLNSLDLNQFSNQDNQVHPKSKMEFGKDHRWQHFQHLE